MEYREYPKMVYLDGKPGVIVQDREEEDKLRGVTGKPGEKAGWPYVEVPVPEAAITLPKPEPAPRKKSKKGSE